MPPLEQLLLRPTLLHLLHFVFALQSRRLLSHSRLTADLHGHRFSSQVGFRFEGLLRDLANRTEKDGREDVVVLENGASVWGE